MSATAQGVVRPADNGKLTLNPLGTRYEIQFDCPAPANSGPSLKGVIRVKARKLWTIPSGGGFVSPLVGSPRVIQGRVKSIEGNRLVVQAGFPICVELPEDQTGFDLKNGSLQPGVMVNVTAFPGAQFEAA